MIRWRTCSSLRRAALATGLALMATAIPLVLGIDTDSALQSSLVLASSSEKLAIDQPITLSSHLPLILDRGHLTSSIKNPSPADTIPKLLVDGAALRLPLDRKRERPAVRPVPAILQQLSDLNVTTLAVRNSSLDIEMENGRTATLADVSADIKMHRRTHFSAAGSATFLGQQIRFEASWRSPVENKSDGSKGIAPLKLSAKSSLLEAVVEGHITTGSDLKLTGNADFRARRLRALARWFGPAIPVSTDLRDARITGPLEWSAGRLVFAHATLDVDGNRGIGALTINTSSPRPSIEGTLGFETFSLDPHLTPLLAAPDSKQPASATELPSIVSAFDADLRLSAEKVTARDIELGRGAVTIAINNGRMVTDIAELGVEGGHAMGQITLDMNAEKPRLGIKGKLSSVDPGRIFTSWLKRNPLLGRGDLIFDGAGSGAALPDMLASLNGKGTFRLTESGRLGLDLNALHYAAKSANHVGWQAAGKGGTPLEQLDAKFSVSNGAITIEHAQAKSGSTPLSGSGKVDIRAQLLDLKVRLGPERPANAPPGANPGAKQNEQPRPDPDASDVLVVRGSWADPAISILGRPFTTTAPAAGNSANVPQK